MDSEVSAHFGRAPGFMTLFTDGSELEFHESRLLREASECAPISALAAVKVRFVVAKSMGKGALRRCHEAGFQIFKTEAGTVAELLSEMGQGLWVDFPDDALCSSTHDHGGHKSQGNE